MLSGVSLYGLTLRLRASKPTIRFTQPDDLCVGVHQRDTSERCQRDALIKENVDKGVYIV